MKVILPLRVAQSRLYYWRIYCLIIVLLAITVVTYFNFVERVKYFFFALVFLFLFLVARVEVVRMLNTITIDEDKILMNKGVFKREHASASFDKIIDFRVYQTLSQRLLGYGTLFINTASDRDLFMHGLKNPRKIKEILIALEQKVSNKEGVTKKDNE